VQSQVENAIKHGISKLPGKGIVTVEARAGGEVLFIQVSNTGTLSQSEPLTGVGFKNSIHRLNLLYGNLAGISISEKHNLVVVEIHLPLKKNQDTGTNNPYESNYN
jgi:LytS/YehU family sensor histidine kinase